MFNFGIKKKKERKGDVSMIEWLNHIWKIKLISFLSGFSLLRQWPPPPKFHDSNLVPLMCLCVWEKETNLKI